nr:MAG TPA: hypothetical protein [Caudoviricetes sp.]
MTVRQPESSCSPHWRVAQDFKHALGDIRCQTL